MFVQLWAKGGYHMRRHWIIPTIVAVIGLTAPAFAQDVHKDLRGQLEGLTAAYTDAYNQADAAAVAALYTKDGELVAPFGNTIIKRGTKEIEQYYQAAFKALKDRHAEFKLDQASQIGADTAVSAGSFVVTGKADNGDAVKLEGHWTGVYVLDGGAWKIRMATGFPNPPPLK
jgi:uncharacterized protein (TIGR02246 family)